MTISRGTWIELRSPDRYWRARRTGPLLEFRHGKLGTKGQVGATLNGLDPSPNADFAKQLAASLSKVL